MSRRRPTILKIRRYPIKRHNCINYIWCGHGAKFPATVGENVFVLKSVKPFELGSIEKIMTITVPNRWTGHDHEDKRRNPTIDGFLFLDPWGLLQRVKVVK